MSLISEVNQTGLTSLCHLNYILNEQTMNCCKFNSLILFTVLVFIEPNRHLSRSLLQPFQNMFHLFLMD